MRRGRLYEQNKETIRIDADNANYNPERIADGARLTAAIQLSAFDGEKHLSFVIKRADASGGVIVVSGEDADGNLHSETLTFNSGYGRRTTTNTYVRSNLTATPTIFTRGTVDVTEHEPQIIAIATDVECVFIPVESTLLRYEDTVAIPSSDRFADWRVILETPNTDIEDTHRVIRADDSTYSIHEVIAFGGKMHLLVKEEGIA